MKAMETKWIRRRLTKESQTAVPLRDFEAKEISATLLPIHNDPPSNDSLALQTSMKSIRPRIHFLDGEIDRMENVLVHLLSQRQKVRAFEDQHRGLPLRCMPAEIISEIFTHCFSEDPISPLSTFSPITFTKVCRWWQNVALATPLLWANLVLPLYGDVTTHHLELLQRWLARSGAALLSLHVRCDPNNPGSSFIPLLVPPLAHRLWKLAISIPYDKFPLLGTQEIPFPVLRFLEVGWAHSSGVYPPIFAHAPQLSQVVLNSALEIRNTLPAPLTQITLLHCFSKDVNALLNVLEQCHNLVEFKMAVAGSARVKTSSFSLPFVTLRHLSSISFHCAQFPLESLTLPALKRLESKSVDISQIEALLLRSSCQLTSLAFTPRPIAGDELIKFLAICPSLEDLDISACYTPLNEVISQLTVGPQDESPATLLPHLRRLSIVANDEISPNSLLAMIVSRFRGVTSRPRTVNRLEDVSIHCTKKWGPEEAIWSEFDFLKTEGLGGSISTSGY